jgi:hypothetical protein
MARWGLGPFWAKDLSIGYKMINARSETVRQKPTFKHSFARRRCLIPADGFFEWAKDGAKKRPFNISRLLHRRKLPARERAFCEHVVNEIATATVRKVRVAHRTQGGTLESL